MSTKLFNGHNLTYEKRKIKSKSYKNLYFYIGKISDAKLSDISTLCSINIKDSEEGNNNNKVISPTYNIYTKKSFRSFSAKNSAFHNNNFVLKNESNKSNKNSQKKILRKSIDKNNNIKVNELKKIEKYSEKNNLDIKKKQKLMIHQKMQM